jgi:hypothetical protein
MVSSRESEDRPCREGDRDSSPVRDVAPERSAPDVLFLPALTPGIGEADLPLNDEWALLVPSGERTSRDGADVGAVCVPDPPFLVALNKNDMARREAVLCGLAVDASRQRAVDSD